MTATEILSELERRGVQLEAHGDRLRFRPVEAVSPDLLETLRARKPEILRLLAQSQVETGGTGKGKCHARVRGQDAVAETAQVEVCWHCHGEKVCRCALCAVPAPQMRWAKGQCRACLGTGRLAWPERVQ